MREIFRFFQRYLFVITFFLLETICILLLTKNNDFQRAASNGFVLNVHGKISTFVANVNNVFSLKNTNAKLAEENALLRKLLITSYRNPDIDTLNINTIQELYSRNEQENPLVFNFIPANVIYNSTKYRDNKILIDKGSVDGIKKKMGVISNSSVVGVITDVTTHYAAVMPILHSEFRVGVKPNHINEYGIAYWDGEDIHYGSVSDIPAHTQLKITDTISTSGYSQIFPKGIPVGIVDEIENKNGTGILNVKIRFIDDYRRASSVYVVENLYNHEFDTLMYNHYE